jgi:hypothetical protein
MDGVVIMPFLALGVVDGFIPTDTGRLVFSNIKNNTYI